MTRNEYVEICSLCLNRKLDPQQGLICKLTDKKADFEDKCPEFINDEKVKPKVIVEKKTIPVKPKKDKKIKKKRQFTTFELINIGIYFFSLVMLILGWPGSYAFGAYLFLAYIISGYWIFNPYPKKKYLIPILTGIIIGTSTLSSLYLIQIVRGVFLLKTPSILSGVLLLTLIIYLLIKKGKIIEVKYYKNIIYRLLVVTFIGSFFAFMPISSGIYRSTVKFFNKAEPYLIENVMMLDNRVKFKSAFGSDDCANALKYAEAAVYHGERWLLLGANLNHISKKTQQDSIEYILDKDELMRMGGIYINLYEANKCQAYKEIDNDNYVEALALLINGDRALYLSHNENEYWLNQKVKSFENMALCNARLGQYEIADSLYDSALNLYIEQKDTFDYEAAIISYNYANVRGKLSDIETSNNLYMATINTLYDDSINEEAYQYLIKSLHGMVNNYFSFDSLENALHYIEVTDNLHKERAEQIRPEDKSLTLKTKLFKGIYHYKSDDYLKAEELFVECLESSSVDNKDRESYYYLLALVEVALAKYDLARGHLEKGLAIVSNRYGRKSTQGAGLIAVQADLEKKLGNYEESENNYIEAIQIFNHILGAENEKLADLYSGIAHLKTDLVEYQKAKEFSDQSLLIASYYVDLTYPSSTSLINNAAFVNYCVEGFSYSDSLYSQTIAINKDYNKKNSVTTAIALNGLGLNNMALKKYKIAEGNFVESLELHNNIYPNDHPLTAVVYLNYGQLKTKQNKLDKAEEMLLKSLEINKQFFKEDHDVFADIYMAYGALEKKRRNHKIAKEYYQKAYEIYLKKFGENNMKTISAKP